MKVKKIVSLLTAITILFSMSMSAVAVDFEHANMNEDLYSSKVTNIINNENMGEVEKSIPLLNSDGEKVAFCLDMESGYLIYDTNGEVVEYSPTNDSPYNGYDCDVYYGGPLDYYVKDKESYLNINTNDFVTDIDFKPIMAVNCSSSDLDNNTPFELNGLVNGNGTIVTKTTGIPRGYNYNPGGYCGALAATIYFFYYYDYKDSNCLSSSYVNNPRSLFNYLSTLIPYLASGTELYEGMNTAMNNNIVKINRTAVGYGQTEVWGLAKYLIQSQNIPSILLVHGAPYYGDHWIVTYGVVACYLNRVMVDRFFIVNDGEGKNDIRINDAYQHNLVYLE